MTSSDELGKLDAATRTDQCVTTPALAPTAPNRSGCPDRFHRIHDADEVRR